MRKVRAMSASPAQKQVNDAQQKAGRRDTREKARAGAMLVLVAIFIAFALANLSEVKVDWIVGSSRAPLIIVIVISLLVGIVLTYLADRLSRRRRQ
jgi:uncharacterized integral membrane protein